MQQRDVLIVGGGPAGAQAGWALARAGARVTLFDASHPREKPCGGGLTGRAMALVAEMAPDAMATGVPATSLRFEASRSRAEFPLPASGCTPASALVVVDRKRLDSALLQAAVRTGVCHVAERVRDIELAGDGVVVQTTRGTWRGDHVIGADGATSLVRRRVYRAFTKEQTSLATGFFVDGVRSSEIRIRAVADPPGYIWSFPREDHLAVGICAQADRTSIAALRDLMARWLEESGLAPGARLQPYSWPIPSLRSADFAAEPLAADRWMLAGDAAGLVDPLTREGIYFALASGRAAADALCGASAPARAYAARVRSRIHPEITCAAHLKERFFTSGFTDLMVSGLVRSEPVRQVMVDLVAGRQPYVTLKRRLVRTLEIRLALQLLWLQIAGRFQLGRCL